ncbi:putative outer membrane protein, probably involved in nutrient binding [Polaribacter irgensii 23-P]|uniref:Putative outer membrane protein, probably involved in nutrient binding n=1 Tax=Polaribacter irgensii 23-P TaxID=313594 RepID=A4BX46_9FLAO|nr:TonB-dependent receptor [Polaribacter irgensii]EAR13537.1 putative outer membrane protein, probably involved in nutrient binding [Polaribacter irgensii 23-P]
MKKNLFQQNEKKFRKKIKVFVIAALLLMVNSFTYGNDKDQKITLKLENTTLTKIFEAISSQTEYNFFYEQSQIDLNSKVSIDVKDEYIKVALLKLFSNLNYAFKIVSTQIIVTNPNNSLAALKKTNGKDGTTKQGFKISGKVLNENNQPLPGASILIKGSKKGVVSDFDGLFQITLENKTDILIISYTGYKTQEIPFSSENIVVKLNPDKNVLNEIVIVVGYGKLAKKRVTGSVSSISSNQIAALPVVSIENAIVGQVAGVQVQETTGEPGASPQIRIRGTGSISAGNDPLFVVDGIPISKGSTSVSAQGELSRRVGRFQQPSSNPLATINPNDIASIEILKDASAAAIYGSRGANGVVIVTTKRGTSKDTGVFSFNSFYGIQNVTNKIDLMNSEELISYARDARNNNYLSSVPGASINNPIGPGDRGNTNYELPESYLNWDGTDTDWQDLIFREATMRSYNFSYASPIKEKTSFYISGGYFNQEGIIAKSEYERFTLLTTINSELTEKLKLDLRLAPTLTNNQKQPANAPYFARPPGIIYSALVHSPIVKPYNSEGMPNQTNNQSHLGGGTTTASNPLAISDAIDDQLFQFQNQASLGLTYEIIPGLDFKTFGGSYINIFNRDFYRANSLLYRNATNGESFGQASASTSVNYLWENTLNYEFEKGDHYLNAVTGYSFQKDKINISQVSANNFPDDQVTTLSGGQVFAGTSVEEEWSLASAFVRGTYSYKDKYLFTGTMRTDKSSRFGDDNQTGYFPSFSLGWRLHKEGFMEKIDAISELKVRLSWGETGNFEIPNYGSVGLLSPSNYNFNGSEANGLLQTTIPNPKLTWEKSAQTNIGVELGLFNNRLFFIADYYKTITSDLLLNVSLTAVSGFNTVLQNLGEVKNEGFEIALRSRNFVNEFSWSTDLNLSANKNEVMSLNAQNEPIISKGGAGERHITRVGSEIGSYYGYVVDGIYQNQTDITNAPVDTQAPNPAPGDLKFKDVNGDGQITAADRTVTGSYFPDFTWGITNNFSYKGVDLSFIIQGVEGNEILNLTRRHLGNGEANFNSYAMWNNRWKSEENPGNGIIPRADRETGKHGNNNRPSSYQVEDGSFIRLRNITFGYTFPENKILNGRIDKLRLYITGNNLFTFTDYLGYNPEVSNISGGLTPGEDYGAYPLNKTIVFGINLNF